jgi:membrane protease YdiL (CAAX protease family)
MNAFWDYFWPIFGAGAIIGIIAGSIAFRAPRVGAKAGPEIRMLAVEKWRRRRLIALVAAVAVSIVAAALWHGPLGAADRFSAEVERSVRQTLNDWEMTQVQGHLHHGPLTRRITLSGPADDFQRTKLVEYIGDVPGVSRAQWATSPAGPPLIVEGTAAALLGFLLGLVLAYLVELRRRYNAQWNW